MGQKNGRHNVSVSATAEVLAAIDRLVDGSIVDTSRSGVALAAIEAGLPIVAARMRIKDVSATARRKGKR